MIEGSKDRSTEKSGGFEGTVITANTTQSKVLASQCSSFSLHQTHKKKIGSFVNLFNDHYCMSVFVHILRRALGKQNELDTSHL